MINLTKSLMKSILPNASGALIDAFVADQNILKDILQSQTRFVFCFANVCVESRSGAVLKENINYTPANVVKNWPKRYGSVAAVQQRFGTAPGWQLKMFDEIYGNRMGNRPGTSDGSRYIGRSVAQITGRDGYSVIGSYIGVDLVNNPETATRADLQPEIVAAFWQWKRMNAIADRGNVEDVRRAWNGGYIGLADVKAHVKRINKIVAQYLALPTAAQNVKPSSVKIDETLKEYQEKLAGLGYYEVGEPDGKIGSKTRGAFVQFCNDRHISISTSPNDGLYQSIDKAIKEKWHRPVAPDRAYATAGDLTPKVASLKATQSAGFYAKLTGWISGIGAGANGVMKFMPDARDETYPYISMAQEFFTSIPGWAYLVVIGAVAYVIYRKTQHATDATVADYQTGKLN